jgi:hypothetical protein
VDLLILDHACSFMPFEDERLGTVEVLLRGSVETADLQSLLPKRLKNRLKDVSIHQVRSKSSHGFDLAPWC